MLVEWLARDSIAIREFEWLSNARVYDCETVKASWIQPPFAIFLPFLETKLFHHFIVNGLLYYFSDRKFDLILR